MSEFENQKLLAGHNRNIPSSGQKLAERLANTMARFLFLHAATEGQPFAFACLN
jgi:hypothetical protein